MVTKSVCSNGVDEQANKNFNFITEVHIYLEQHAWTFCSI